MRTSETIISNHEKGHNCFIFILAVKVIFQCRQVIYYMPACNMTTCACDRLLMLSNAYSLLADI